MVYDIKIIWFMTSKCIMTIIFYLWYHILINCDIIILVYDIRMGIITDQLIMISWHFDHNRMKVCDIKKLDYDFMVIDWWSLSVLHNFTTDYEITILVCDIMLSWFVTYWHIMASQGFYDKTAVVYHTKLTVWQSVCISKS